MSSGTTVIKAVKVFREHQHNIFLANLFFTPGQFNSKIPKHKNPKT